MNLCTSRKFDSRGNDAFFIMTPKLKEWFLKLPFEPMDTSPDYSIFNMCYVEQSIKSGIVRNYKRINGWNFYHCHLNIRNYWLPEQLFEPIRNEIFINKLKNIMYYQEVI
jgi:hypothetical protein